MNCIESLSASTRALGHWRAKQIARRSCLGNGVKPGTYALSACELSPTRAASASAVDSAAISINSVTLRTPAKSYYKASSDEISQREQMACARLGYDPIGDAFSSCVASLDLALWNAKHPLR